MGDDSMNDRVRESAMRMQESGVAALSGLYDVASQRLLRLAVAITGHQHDAEDALQAVLLRVADSPNVLFQAEQPWHYLLRMTRNESLLIVRRRKRTLSMATLAELTNLVTRHFVDQTEQEETHRAVWHALRKLPREQSEVVVLKIWESLTFAQIGQVLDVSPATAASRYRYALHKLQHRLARHRQEGATLPAGCQAREEASQS